jgi:hypothetical protein
MIEEKCYQHSGNSNIAGLVIALGIGTIIAIVLGFLYNFLIIIIPIVYINLFITIGFGTALGYSIKFLSRFGKIRNDRQNLILAGIIGFVGFYFQWIAYLVYLTSESHSFQAYQENFNLIYNPAVLGQLILEVNKIGSWAMFGVIFTDFPLWVIWGIEALLIIGIPILIALRHPIIPFSETLNKWYPKYVIKNQFESIAGQNQFKENLLENVLETVNNLSYGTAFRFSEISIYYLKDEMAQYLSVDNIFIEGRGKGKETKTSVMHLLQIDNKTAEALMEKHKTKKAFALDY